MKVTQEIPDGDVCGQYGFFTAGSNIPPVRRGGCPLIGLTTIKTTGDVGSLTLLCLTCRRHKEGLGHRHSQSASGGLEILKCPSCLRETREAEASSGADQGSDKKGEPEK